MEKQVREIITQISVIVGDSDRLLSDKLQIDLARKKAQSTSGVINPPEIAQYVRQNEADASALDSVLTQIFPNQTIESLRERLLTLKAAVDQLTEIKIDLAKTTQALTILQRTSTDIQPAELDEYTQSIATLTGRVNAYEVLIQELTTFQAAPVIAS